MPKPNTKNPELMGSEKMNVKAHFYYGMFNIMNESADSMRMGFKGSLLSYHAALDFFYDMLCGTILPSALIGIEYPKDGKREFKEIREKIDDSITGMYLGTAKERIKFYKLLKQYQSLLLYNVRNTGLVPANKVSFIMGVGEETELSDSEFPEFPKPKEVTTSNFAKPLSETEEKTLDEFKIKKKETGLYVDTQDEE